MIEIKLCEYHNIPYLVSSKQNSFWYQQLPSQLRHNVWISTVGNNNPITTSQLLSDILKNQLKSRTNTIQFVFSKRDSISTKTSIDKNWASFEQMAPFIKKDKPKEKQQQFQSQPPIVTNHNDNLIKAPVRRSTRIKYKIHESKINKIVESPSKPPVPAHSGEALKSHYATYWMETLFA